MAGGICLKLLVLSDSHGAQFFMQKCVDLIQPDAVLHLGDLVRDAEELATNNPGLTVYQVAGNCDGSNNAWNYPESVVENFGGVRIFMTHGHRQGVKIFLSKLIADGRQCGADVILYGHTHAPDCHQLEDGCWVMNPGSAGYGTTAGLITIRGKRNFSCNILRYSDLEALHDHRS